MSVPPVYFVGAPWKGHAEHSGYELFCDLAGRKLWRFPRRDLPGLAGKVLDRLVGRCLGRRYYTFGNLLTELYAVGHLLTHRRAYYHVLYGDSDSLLVPWVLRRVRRHASTTLHLPEHRHPQGFRYDMLRPFETVFFLADSHRRSAQPHLPHTRCVVLPHAVDTDFFTTPPPHPGDPVASVVDRPEARTALSVGAHLRDFPTLAAGLRLLIQADIVDHLDLVGVPADERVLFDDLIAAGRATFRIDVSDPELRALYQQATVVVLALHDAYANNALLEAMACGCVIVASDVGAVREYLGNAGWCCPPHDPTALADTVVQALAEPRRVSAARRRARHRSLGFSRARSAQQFSDLLALTETAPARGAAPRIGPGR